MYVATFKSETGQRPRDFAFIDLTTNEQAMEEAKENAVMRGMVVASLHLLGREIHPR